MYSLTSSSSFPHVDTKYPRDQKLSPVKFCLRPPKFRAIYMALLPFTKPATYETEYFADIDTSICTGSDIRCPSHTRLSFCCAKFLSTSPGYLRKLQYMAFLRYLGSQTMWYLQSLLVCFKLWYSSTENLLSVDFERFTESGGFLIFPDLSNFGSPPAKTGVIPVIIKKR